jgi:hypothetical protein
MVYLGLPIKNGDVRYKSPFSHGFPVVYLLKMVDLSMANPSELSHWVMVWQQGTHDRMSGLWRRGAQQMHRLVAPFTK